MNQPYNQIDVENLYKLIGESVWHLQHLENILSSYTTLVILQRNRNKGKRLTEKDAEQSLNGQQKQVLGQLIGSAKVQKTIPENMHARFELFLNERNWVIHNCVVNEYLSLRHNDEKIKLFTRIGKFSEEAKQLTKEMHCQFEAWFSECGYSLEEAHLKAERILINAEKS